MIIKSDSDIIRQYTTDASNYRGTADILYIPEDNAELITVVKECYDKNILMTVSGAGTGLTGGRVPNGGAVISTERLNKIINIDTVRRIATVQPGVTYSQLEDELKPMGFFLPPNPTEKNSFLGGNVSTNASGARTFKYGSIRNWVAGLKVIISDGEVLNLNRPVLPVIDNFYELTCESGKRISINLPVLYIPEIKHAAGYYLKKEMDLSDLFIGSEGTLGIIAEIQLKFLELPERLMGAVIYFEDYEDLIQFVEEIRELSISNHNKNYRDVNQINSRLIEFYDSNSLDYLREQFPLIPAEAQGAIWIEQEFSDLHEEEILNQWYRLIKNYSSLTDETWIALNQKENDKMRDFRHALPLRISEEIVRNKQVKIGTDIAVPPEYLKEYFFYLIKEMNCLNIPFVFWSHIGNCHFHANILAKNEAEKKIGEEFYSNCITEALKLGGTISSEHGVGKLKKKYLAQMFGDYGIQSMKAVKNVFDPKGLLGQGNLF